MRFLGFEITRRQKRTRFLGDLVSLKLNANDVCVLMANDPVSKEEAQAFSAAWRAKFGEIPLVVLDKGMRLGVLSPPQAEKARMHIDDSDAIDEAVEK